MVGASRRRGPETCVTPGHAARRPGERFKAAGLDYCNHNLDTAAEFYGQVITTHSQADRYATLEKVRAPVSRLLRRHRRHSETRARAPR